MASMKEHLAAEQVLARMLISKAADGLLTSLLIQDSQRLSDARETGHVLIGVVDKLGIFDLNLIAPASPRPYVLLFDGPSGARTGFRLAVSLPDGPLFTLLPDVAGRVLTAAEVKTGPDSEWLEQPLVPTTTKLTGVGVWLVLQGRLDGTIEIKLSPNSDPPDKVITLKLEPPAALLGGSGFGLSFPEGISIDQADQAVAPGKTVVDGKVINTPADTPSWQGIVVRKARFFLPREVPFLGGHAVDAHVQVGLPPTPGIDLVITTTVPAKDGRPAIAVRFECHDPTASGLAGFVPTLVQMVMDLPLDGRQETFDGENRGLQAFTLAAGKPVRIRATYARKPAPPSPPATPDTAELSVAFESQGPAGLVRIDSSDGNLGSKIAVTAATLATALIAEEAPPNAGETGVMLQKLLTAAVALSSFLDTGQVVVHSAEFVTTGGVIPAGMMQLKIDYSVAATVTGVNVGVMSLQMQPNQPLRVRVREVILTINPKKSGLEMINLDYTKSSLEIEDPGGWKVTGPGSLFDVLGTRSGRGSMWLEVDLRFKLDLGPVKVSGVTVRGTLDNSGKMSGELRGLEASIALAPMIDGTGTVQLTNTGFFAALAAQILPLRIGARADFEKADDMVKLALGVDLPGPLPLANTGLGIYGIGGVFAANGKPKPVPAGQDPVDHQLKWNYKDKGSFVPAEAFSFGLEAVIGTAVDMGFTFSARAGLFITTPEFAVRGALNGRFMGERVKITRDEEGGPGIRAKGVVVIDPNDGVTIGIEGTYEIPEILEIVVPVGARFPRNSSDWYIHLGADGWTPPQGGKTEGRERGPVRAKVLPNLIPQNADAYLMFRGNGITNWPRGGPVTINPKTFMAAFGFGFDIMWGLKPLVWVEIFVRADILISTNPRTFVGLGRAGGSLHVGIFSVGVDASVHVVIMQGAPPYFLAELCGTVDLFIDEIHECVKISFNSSPPAVLPTPPHPLDSPRGQVLVDDAYREIGPLAATRADAAVVWPDAIPLLSFAVAPDLSLPAGGQFPDAADYPESVRARPIGGDLLQYKWQLLNLSLIDSTDPNNEFLVAGPMSATWQKGKFGDAGEQAQPAELALLTPSGDLWLNAMPDAGTDLPHKPLEALANICQARVSPIPGWALGAGATRQGDGWHLPPDPLSTDPIQSQVRATAELHLKGIPATGGDMVLELATAPFLPAPFGYSGPRIREFVPVTLDDRMFSAFLEPGAVLIPPDNAARDRQPIEQELRLVANEPLSQARVWLVVERTDWPNANIGVSRLRVTDDLGQTWTLDEEHDLGGGYVGLRWRPPGPNPVNIVRARSDLAGFRVGVIALGGITATADAAAAARNAASHAEAEKQRQVCESGLPPPGAPNSNTKRCTLKPGRTYRLDVEMQWSGTLLSKDDKGNTTIVKKRPVDATDTTISTRSYWYRTAKLGGPNSARGTVAFAQHLYRKNDRFDPDMLVRHLRGYEPAQSELHRFANDPVRVHFAYGHVKKLASDYGFDLMCGLRRLDAPEPQEPDQFLATVLQRPTTTAFMTGPEKLIAEAYLKSPCGLCPQGAVLHTPVQLSRSTWYEVYVHAEAQDGNHGRIPGVSFRTSRWGGGAEMLAALQFPVNGSGQPHGGVALRSNAVLSPKTIVDDDGAFDAMLDELGMDGWPAAAEPRVSLLWREIGSQWRCAGVFIESPEPIHRPGRFHVNGFSLRMGLTAPAFDVVLRDRSGSRLLFATSAPFLPRMSRVGFFQLPVPPALRLDCTDLPIGQPVVPLTGWLEVPLRPSFAEEAV
ncbi:MAG TPA: hypothetical protein VJM12_18135 [Pyrinomonadaceae bacterium]|nr:hypothetical protein [Pyrinomonadaceae bacterium]